MIQVTKMYRSIGGYWVVSLWRSKNDDTGTTIQDDDVEYDDMGVGDDRCM